MIPVVSVDTMRRSDAWTIQNGIASKELMERAGRAIFKSGEWISPVAIFCGSGNNAGDGYVTALEMQKNGINSTLILLSHQFSEDGLYFYKKCSEHNIPQLHYSTGMDLRSYGSILDCLLGTGFHGNVTGIMRDAIQSINQSGIYTVSADINSGLNGDTGNSECCVHSDLTVSIGCFKLGHFSGISSSVMKKKINCDIGIEIVGPVHWLSDY